MPLLLADKTYNSSHPNYNADLVRNDPHRVFNVEKSSWNPTYRKLLPFIHQQNNASYLDNSVWQNILQEAREELLTIPHASEIFKNQTYLENYVADLTHRYQAHYIPGWVNLNVALFLYWLVRQNQPKTIVQTGVCNGFSSAFIALALVKNGNGGKLYAIDLPAIFDPKDPNWTMKNSIYGVVVPTSKSPGWMIPDAYRDCLKLQLGDAKQLLPSLVNHLDSIDMFYHDSDHTYHHMLFEFQEVRRKLSAGSLVVADDIAWNASLWDFADAQQVAAYNYQGTAGVAFF